MMRTNIPSAQRGFRAGGARVLAYLRALGWALAVALVIGGALALVQAFFHPFDFVIEGAEKSLAAIDTTFSASAVAGVSVGSLVLIAAAATIPLFKKGVRRRQYFVSFWRGIVSAAIFLATDKLYRYVQSLGILYFSATLALFLAATIILVEIVARAGKVEEEAERRTEFLASIVSGLVFGLLVQLGEYLFALLGRALGA